MGDYQEQPATCGTPTTFDTQCGRYQLTKTNPGLHQSEEVMTIDMLIGRWTTVRENYATRSLTYPADRKNAVSSTSQDVAQFMDDIDTSGHLTDNLHTELLWHLTTEPG
jgi:hypothetical protein